MELNGELSPLVIVSDTYSALDEVKRHVTPQTKAKIFTYPKSTRMHVPPILMLTTWVHGGTMAIQKHPVAERHLRNAHLIQSRAGGLMLEKVTPDSPDKIDCMDALLSAVGGWINSQKPENLGKDEAPHPASIPPLKSSFKGF